MNIRRLWWLVAVGAAVFLAIFLAMPVWAATSTQGDDPPSDSYSAMHEACESGDVPGMTDAMNSLTDGDWEAMGDGHHGGIGSHMTGEDWEVMRQRMGDGHHGDMGSGMMGRGGMMGGWSGRSMMGR